MALTIVFRFDLKIGYDILIRQGLNFEVPKERASLGPRWGALKMKDSDRRGGGSPGLDPKSRIYSFLFLCVIDGLSEYSRLPHILILKEMIGLSILDFFQVVPEPASVRKIIFKRRFSFSFLID